VGVVLLRGASAGTQTNRDSEDFDTTTRRCRLLHFRVNRAGSLGADGNLIAQVSHDDKVGDSSKSFAVVWSVAPEFIFGHVRIPAQTSLSG